MVTAAAWQRTIDGLDPDAFGKLVAEEVLGAAAPLLGPDGSADRDHLETLIGMGALSGFRRLIDTVQLEAMTGELEEDDPTLGALATTISVVQQAREALLRPEGTALAVELLDGLLESWQRATR
jgi:hypothetical protein